MCLLKSGATPGSYEERKCLGGYAQAIITVCPPQVVTDESCWTTGPRSLGGTSVLGQMWRLVDPSSVVPSQPKGQPQEPEMLACHFRAEDRGCGVGLGGLE